MRPPVAPAPAQQNFAPPPMVRRERAAPAAPRWLLAQRAFGGRVRGLGRGGATQGVDESLRVRHAGFPQGWGGASPGPIWREEKAVPEPMIPKSKLYLREKRVLEAFESREWKVDVGGDFLRAEFLSDLFLGSHGDWHPRRVVIENANIANTLNMDHCNVLHPLYFSECRFLNGLSLEASTVPTLDLRGCRISREGESKDASVYVFVASGMKATDVKLNDGFIAEGGVSLAGANIAGQLVCSGGRFERDLDALGLKALRVLLNRGFTARSDVNLSSANIAGQLVCAGGKFEGKLLAQDLTAESVFFSEEFEVKDLVILSGANIADQLVCMGGTFMGCCEVEGRQVCFLAQNLKAGSVLLGGKFKGNGQVILNGSNVNGQFSCEGGEFKGILLAEGLKAKNVFLRNGFKSESEVRLLGANISEQLDCQDGTFGSDLNLIDATIGVFHSNEKSWPKKGFLHLDGLHYQRLQGGAGDSAKAGLEWLFRMGDGKFHPQPYEQLMSVYRRMGHTSWARDIGYELEKERARKSDEFKGWRRIHRRIWHCILKLTIGYGYKPLRFTGTAGILWFLGALVFWRADKCGCGLWLSSPSIPEHYPQFVPIAYALEALFPVLGFGQLDNWYPGSTWLLVLRWSMTFIGTVLFGDFIRQILGVLGPRWGGRG